MWRHLTNRPVDPHICVADLGHCSHYSSWWPVTGEFPAIVRRHRAHYDVTVMYTNRVSMNLIHWKPYVQMVRGSPHHTRLKACRLFSVLYSNVYSGFITNVPSKINTMDSSAGKPSLTFFKSGGVVNVLKCVIGIDTNNEVIEVKPEVCGELHWPLIRPQWRKIGYQFQFYHDENISMK